MAESAFPFDAGPGANVLENSWQKMAREWLATGVISGRLNQLAVSADGSALSVSVATGQAQVEGFFYENDSAKAIPLNTANATNPRIDTIVARLDRTANTVIVDKVTGTAASSPVAPTLTQTDSLYELPLADVTVPAAAGVIVAGNVSDRRAYTKNLTEAAANAAYAAKSATSAKAFLTANLSVANATGTIVGLTSESWDSGTLHDTATNPSRITVPADKAGQWRITAAVLWGASGAGFRSVAVFKNGTQIADANQGPVSGAVTSQSVITEDRAVAGDYYELRVYQTSGGALDLVAGGGNTFLIATFVGA